MIRTCIGQDAGALAHIPQVQRIVEGAHAVVPHVCDFQHLAQFLQVALRPVSIFEVVVQLSLVLLASGCAEQWLCLAGELCSELGAVGNRLWCRSLAALKQGCSYSKVGQLQAFCPPLLSLSSKAAGFRI